jgi:hypothetical protein
MASTATSPGPEKIIVLMLTGGGYGSWNPTHCTWAPQWKGVSAAANGAQRFDHVIVAPATLAGKYFAAERVHHVVATHALGASATVRVIVARKSRDNPEAQTH